MQMHGYMLPSGLPSPQAGLLTGSRVVPISNRTAHGLDGPGGYCSVAAQYSFSPKLETEREVNQLK